MNLSIRMPMCCWSFSRVRESPLWTPTTFASPLWFWTLKSQSLWFIISHYMKQFLSRSNNHLCLSTTGPHIRVWCTSQFFQVNCSMRGKQLHVRTTHHIPPTVVRIFHVWDFLGSVLALKYMILTPDLHATYVSTELLGTFIAGTPPRYPSSGSNWRWIVAWVETNFRHTFNDPRADG